MKFLCFQIRQVFLCFRSDCMMSKIKQRYNRIPHRERNTVFGYIRSVAKRLNKGINLFVNVPLFLNVLIAIYFFEYETLQEDGDPTYYWTVSQDGQFAVKGCQSWWPIYGKVRLNSSKDFDARWSLQLFTSPSADLKIGVKRETNDGDDIMNYGTQFYGYVCEHNVVFNHSGHIIELPAPHRLGGNDIIVVRLTINDNIQRLSFYKNGEKVHSLTQDGLPTGKNVYYKFEIRIKNVGESVTMLNFKTK